MGEGDLPHHHYIYTGRNSSFLKHLKFCQCDCGRLMRLVFAAHAPLWQGMSALVLQ